MRDHVLALDQGTTSSRAVLFGPDARAIAIAQREFPQLTPRPGEVEHDPEAIWDSQLTVAREALTRGGLDASRLAAVGVTNQRETTLLWERDTGRPVANAIVWQSRVSAPVCERARAAGYEPLIRERTGLVLDPYFSGSKIRHLLDSRPELRPRAERGEILFGTVDTFLAWRLTGGQVHVTDVSNASRTLLFNIHTLDWDDELLRIFQVPRAMLPRVADSDELVGEVSAEWLGAPVPLAAAAGDQQAATFGQCCFTAGDCKNTYGTGCFLLMNVGEQPVSSRNGLLTTVGWRLGGRTTYCLEGSVFMAGAVVQWLRDGLGIIQSSAEVEELAGSVPDSGGVVLVPAFVGLGAPHWDPYARGAIFGLTRGATRAHVARAALESLALQTGDVIRAMSADAAVPLAALKVDGGAAANNLLMQLQADVIDAPVRRPRLFETTALGAAGLAGLAVGLWDQAGLAGKWELDREFRPAMESSRRESLLRAWNEAVRRSLRWESPGESSREHLEAS